MKPALIDTNILSFFFRNHSLVVERFEAYLRVYSKITALSGVMRYISSGQDARTTRVS
jgi:hypothetical protein